MGRFVAGDAPELDRALADALAAIGAEIGAMRVPSLAGVVLGGGYGRGEGGARGELKVQSSKLKVESSKSDVACRLSNDLDFFAITKEGATDADAAAVAKALEPLSRRWSEKLGIDVDFTGRTPWRLRHDQERLMVQELVHGYVDVAGATGESLFAGIARREPSDLPWMEAARLLMNRGMGLLFAKCKIENGKCKVDGLPNADCRMSDADIDFVNRNINKCILGAGDAFLISRGLYRWRATERADACEAQGFDRLYRAAVEWKFRPSDGPVCDWETAREEWLDAKLNVTAAVDDEGFRRSVRSAARWVVRRRTLGEVATFGMNPVVRILERVARCVESRSAIPPSLRRDWEIFN
jgi:hypothetical protein